MSDMEKKLNLTPIREQVVKVMNTLSKTDIFDPIQNGGDATDTVEALVSYAEHGVGRVFGTTFGYGQIEVVFTLEMTDVSTNGDIIHMTPMIAKVTVAPFPLPRKDMDYSAIECLCNEAAQKVLVSSNV